MRQGIGYCCKYWLDPEFLHNITSKDLGIIFFILFLVLNYVSGSIGTVWEFCFLGLHSYSSKALECPRLQFTVLLSSSLIVSFAEAAVVGVSVVSSKLLPHSTTRSSE